MSTELDTFFETHPECRFVDVLLPDLCNVIRGKRLGRDDIRKFYQEGLQIPSSIMALDVTGTCTDAIVFGDLNDPESRISKLTKDPRQYKVLEELNAVPTVSYLTNVRNRKSGDDTGANHG